MIPDKVAELYGCTIQSLRLNTEMNRIELELTFGQYNEHRVLLYVEDEGRTCCGRRYIHTDDVLPDRFFNNEKLVEFELNHGPTTNRVGPDAESVHDAAFFSVRTSRRVFTFCTHNLHNGNYDGFDFTFSVCPVNIYTARFPSNDD